MLGTVSNGRRCVALSLSNKIHDIRQRFEETRTAARVVKAPVGVRRLCGACPNHNAGTQQQRIITHATVMSVGNFMGGRV